MRNIARALKRLHRRGVLHRNLHSGNIVVNARDDEVCTGVTDVGLCRPLTSSAALQGIYGVIPYMAPELLKGESFSKASDVYALGIFMWELSAREPAFNYCAHNMNLMLQICNGLRPRLIENTPPCWVRLMQRCWDGVPSERPTAAEIYDTVQGWKQILTRDASDHDGLMQQFENADEYYKQQPQPEMKMIHADAIYTSRCIQPIPHEVLSRIL
jgi:serine/threonine protein kinase